MSMLPVKRGGVVPPQNAVPFPFPFPTTSPPPIPTVGSQVPVVVPPVGMPQAGPWWKSPALPGMLMAIGSQLGAPPQFGQNAWGKLAQAFGAGYNYLQQYRQLPQLMQNEQWERQMRVEELRRKNYEAETGRKSQAAQEAAAGERNAISRERVGIEQQRVQNEQQRAKDAHAIATQELEVRRQQLKQALETSKDKLKLETARLEELRRSNRAKEDVDRQKVAVDRARLEVEKAKAEAKATGALSRAVSTPEAFARVVVPIMSQIREAAMLSGEELTDQEVMDRALEVLGGIYSRYDKIRQGQQDQPGQPSQPGQQGQQGQPGQQGQQGQQSQQGQQGARTFQGELRNGQVMVAPEAQKALERPQQGDTLHIKTPDGKTITRTYRNGKWQ